VNHSTHRRLVLLALALAPAASIAQVRRRPAQIAVFWIASDGQEKNLGVLREALRTYGYAEPGDIQIIARHVVSSYDRLPEAAAQLATEKVDLIVSYGATATVAVVKATSGIPIVMITGTDPVKLGVADSLSKPGRNATGLTFMSADIRGKRLEVLRELAPTMRRVGAVYASESPSEVAGIKGFEAIAAALRIDVQRVEIRTPDEIDAALARVAPGAVDALHVNTSTMFFANRDKLVGAVAKTRLPATFGSREYAEAGGLMSYGPNVLDGFRVAAGYIDKILRGAKASDIPIQQATKFELVINAKSARTVGIAVPASLLARADEVLQ